MSPYAVIQPPDGESDLWWGTFFNTVADGVYEAGNVNGETLEEVIRKLNSYFDTYSGVSIWEACQCGGKVVGFKPFEVGHSHWCPVSITR